MAKYAIKEVIAKDPKKIESVVHLKQGSRFVKIHLKTATQEQLEKLFAIDHPWIEEVEKPKVNDTKDSGKK